MATGGRSLPRAVVCDDRNEVRHALTRLLQSCGFAVDRAVSSFAPLSEHLQREQPEVAVMTLPLAGMSGLAAVRSLHEHSPACRLVLLSAFGQLQIAAVEAGAAALVPEDDFTALQAVLKGIASDLEHRVVTLPSPRAQMAARSFDGSLPPSSGA